MRKKNIKNKNKYSLTHTRVSFYPYSLISNRMVCQLNQAGSIKHLNTHSLTHSFTHSCLASSHFIIVGVLFCCFRAHTLSLFAARFSNCLVALQCDFLIATLVLYTLTHTHTHIFEFVAPLFRFVFFIVFIFFLILFLLILIFINALCCRCHCRNRNASGFYGCFVRLCQTFQLMPVCVVVFFLIVNLSISFHSHCFFTPSSLHCQT